MEGNIHTKQVTKKQATIECTQGGIIILTGSSLSTICTVEECLQQCSDSQQQLTVYWGVMFNYQLLEMLSDGITYKKLDGDPTLKRKFVQGLRSTDWELELLCPEFL